MKFLFESRVPGYPRTLSPSFAGIISIEEKTGKGLLEILRDLSTGKVGLGVLAALAWGLSFRNGKESLSYEEVGDYIVKLGVEPFSEPVVKCISASINGLDNQKKTAEDRILDS